MFCFPTASFQHCCCLLLLSFKESKFKKKHLKFVSFVRFESGKINRCVLFAEKGDKSHRVKTYMLVTAYQGFRVRSSVLTQG